MLANKLKEEENISISMKVAGFISLICERISMTMIIIMLFIVWGQVFLRYINIGFPWAEEVCRYMMVWLGMIGATILVIEEGHIQISFLLDKFNYRIQLILKIIVHIITFWTIYHIVKYGINYAMSGSRMILASLPITRFWTNLAIPVGGLLILFNLAILIWRDLKILLNRQKGFNGKEEK